MTQKPHGQGGIEYILLIGGILLVVVLTIVVLQGGLLGGLNRQVTGGAGVYLQLVNPCQAVSQLIIHPNGTNATLTICQSVPPNATIVTIFSLPLVFNGAVDGPGNMTFFNDNTQIFLNLTGKNNGQPIPMNYTHTTNVQVNASLLIQQMPAIIDPSVPVPPGPDTTPPALVGAPIELLGTDWALIYFDVTEPSNMTITFTPANSTGGTSTGHAAFHDPHPASQAHNITGLNASTTYTYNVTLCDTTGNCALALQDSFTTLAVSIPNTPPAVTLNSPTNESTVSNGSTTFTYTPIDNAGFYNATLFGNFTGTFTTNSSNATAVVNNTINNLTTNLNPGYYHWNVQACDNSLACAFTTTNYTLTVTAPVSLSCATPPTGLVSWWPGDNNPNDIIGPNGATLQGGATFASGKAGQAFSFPNGGEYVSAPTNGLPTGSSARTLEIWVKIDAMPASEAFFAGYGAFGSNTQTYHLGALNDRRLFFSNWGETVVGPVLTLGQWYHVAVTNTGNSVTLYVDGGQVASGTNTINTVSGTFYIGSIAGDSIRRLKGSVDEVTIYNRTLSLAEIQTIYNFSSAGKCKPACTPAPSGLAGWWPAEGSANDINGTNGGALQNGATLSAGKVGQAFSLDGTDDYINVPKDSSIEPTNAITVDAWIYPTALTGGQRFIINKAYTSHTEPYYSYDLSWTSDLLYWQINTGGTRTVTYYPATPANFLNRWTHVAGTYTGTTMKLYINGQEVNSTPKTGTIPYYNTPLTLGKNVNAGATPNIFQGLIDEVEVFNRALSLSEIQAIYNASSAGKCKPDTDGDGVTDLLDACPSTPNGTTVNLAGCPVNQCLAQPSGLTNWWSANGDAQDNTGNNDGTLTGGTTFAAGKVGQAFSLDGTDDYINVPKDSSIEPTNAITVDAWIYPTALTGGQRFIINKAYTSHTEPYYSYDLSWTSDLLYWQINTGGVRTAITYPAVAANFLNRWTHVAGTYTGTTMKLYINGQEVTSTPKTGTITYYNTPLTLGKNTNSVAPSIFQGLIDEVHIHNRALSATEIHAVSLANSSGLCQTQCIAPPSNLVSWWPAEGSSNDISDSNHGTLQGGATFATGKVGRAFSLDGVDDAVLTGKTWSQLGITQGLTVMAWIDPANNRTGNIVGDTSAIIDFAANETFASAAQHAFTNKSITTLSQTGLYHITATYSDVRASQPNTIKIYINGALMNTTTQINSAFSPLSETVRIGHDTGGAGRTPFQGTIDEMQIYNRSLSANEIQTIYNASSAGVCRQACAPQPSNLVTWWTADGTANDLIGTNHGSALNGATYGPGQVGQGFLLDGADDMVQVPDSNSLDLPPPFSIVGWIKPNAVGYRAIMSKFSSDWTGGGYFFQTSNGTPTTEAVAMLKSNSTGWDSIYSDPTVFPAGQWVQVAVTWDGTTNPNTYKLYVNGTLAKQQTATSTTLTANTFPLAIGRYQPSVAYGFSGTIDELQVYNRALTASEIADIYNASNIGMCRP